MATDRHPMDGLQTSLKKLLTDDVSDAIVAKLLASATAGAPRARDQLFKLAGGKYDSRQEDDTMKDYLIRMAASQAKQHLAES